MDEDSIIVTVEESGERIDALLSHNLENMTRSSVQRLIEAGDVTVNGVPVRKNYKCAKGDRIEVILPEPFDSELTPQDIPLEIAYEDDSLLVVNKPRGMVVHPAPGHYDGTLVNALLFHCQGSLSGIGGEKRPGIVHRIDKDTSGLIIVAKNDFAHQRLSAQLSDHTLSRVYEAVVNGNMKENSGTVSKAIARSEKDRKKMAVAVNGGRPAVTHWELINSYRGYSHIRCRLETGRTHQIRVHMASINHPLLGDYTYGSRSPDKGLEGQCLHARTIRFIHPDTGRPVEITSELPDYFQDVLSRLGSTI